MGKEADASRRGSDRAAYGGGAEEGEPVAEWVEGIPCADELMPLSQPLITPELASAFGITPEPTKTILDVYRASEETMGALCGKGKSAGVLLPSDSPSVLRKFLSLAAAREDDAPVAEEDDVAVVVGKDGVDESSPRKARRLDEMASTEEGEPGGRPEDESVDDPLARTLKRPRLVWTAQLHKRFVDVIAHLGIKNAVPRAIMQLMNVEGLTRENVASHLQKYRLYLKRMQGLSDEGPSSSDQLFASTPVPPSLHEAPVPVPVPYPAPPAMIPLPVYGLPQHGHGGQMGMMHINGQVPGGVHYTGIVSRHPYAMFGQPADWSGRNNFGTMTSHPSRVTPNDR